MTEPIDLPPAAEGEPAPRRVIVTLDPTDIGCVVVAVDARGDMTIRAEGMTAPLLWGAAEYVKTAGDDLIMAARVTRAQQAAAQQAEAGRVARQLRGDLGRVD